MSKRYDNMSEKNMINSIDWKSGGKNQQVPESMITASPEQAMQTEIELAVMSMADVMSRSAPMKERIMHDLHMAGLGGLGKPEDIAKARERLAKFGIRKEWPAEILGVVQDRINDGAMGMKGPDYNKDPKYQDFHKLFKDVN